VSACSAAASSSSSSSSGGSAVLSAGAHVSRQQLVAEFFSLQQRHAALVSDLLRSHSALQQVSRLCKLTRLITRLTVDNFSAISKISVVSFDQCHINKNIIK